MGRYTAAELELMAGLVAREMANRFADDVLREQHQAAKRHAAETGEPVQGVCPTMLRGHPRTASTARPFWSGSGGTRTRPRRVKLRVLTADGVGWGYEATSRRSATEG